MKIEEKFVLGYFAVIFLLAIVATCMGCGEELMLLLEGVM